MGRINFTKQEAFKEGEKILVNIHQQQEYTLENIQNVIKDSEEALVENQKFIEQFDTMVEKALEVVEERHKANIDEMTRVFALTEEKYKEEAWKKFQEKEKQKIMEVLKNKDKIKEHMLNAERDRLNKMKLEVLQGIEQAKAGKALFEKALNGQ